MSSGKDFWTKLTVTPSRAKRLLALCLESGTTAMMWGNYGVGKTSIVKELFNDLNKLDESRRFNKLVMINPSQTDIIDFKVPHVREIRDTGEFISSFAFSDYLPHRNDGRCIIFVDEINTAPQSLQPTLYSLILEGRIGNYKLPDGCFRVAAGNREEDGCAAQPMSNALKDRLNLHMNVEPRRQCWGRWACQNGIREEIQAWVQFSPESSLKGHSADDPTGGCTPRSLEALSRQMDSLARHNLLDTEDEDIILTGTIGQAAGSEFKGFLKIYRSETNIDEILKNPTKAKLYTRGDLNFCIAYALANEMNEENIGTIFKYLERMEPTYMILCAYVAMEKDKGRWMNNKVMREFIRKNVQMFT